MSDPRLPLLHISSSIRLKGSTMKTLQHSIDIPASPSAVWQVLTGTSEYETWNPFMTHLSGSLAAGEQLTVTIRAGGRTMTFRPTVKEYTPVARIRWLGRLGVRGIFDGEHELHLEPLPTGGTRFTQRETFRGLLVPLMRSVLADTEAGFEAMNHALRARAATIG